MNLLWQSELMDSVKLLDFFEYFVGYLNYSDDYCVISYGTDFQVFIGGVQ